MSETSKDKQILIKESGVFFIFESSSNTASCQIHSAISALLQDELLLVKQTNSHQTGCNSATKTQFDVLLQATAAVVFGFVLPSVSSSSSQSTQSWHQPPNHHMLHPYFTNSLVSVWLSRSRLVGAELQFQAVWKGTIGEEISCVNLEQCIHKTMTVRESQPLCKNHTHTHTEKTHRAQERFYEIRSFLFPVLVL